MYFCFKVFSMTLIKTCADEYHKMFISRCKIWVKMPHPNKVRNSNYRNYRRLLEYMDKVRNTDVRFRPL